MAQPVTVISELIREFGERLNDPTSTMDEREMRAALDELRRVQRDTPFEERGALFGLTGVLRSRLGLREEALEAHRNAARYDKANAEHPSNIAAILLELGRFREALESTREARKRPVRDHGTEICILVNEAIAHGGLGDVANARRSLEDAMQCVDPESPVDLFRIAANAAVLGAEEDAIEYFARYLAVASRVDLGETPAIEFVTARLDEVQDLMPDRPALREAIEHVGARHNAPVPLEHRIVTQIELPRHAMSALDALVARPPEPPPAMPKVLGGSRR